MSLEVTQLLNNALIANDPTYKPIYKQTHKNHPASIWASQSKNNFNWLNDLGLALCQEYTFRYIRMHKCQQYLQSFKENNAQFKQIEMTPFALCMPDKYKTNNAVISYRNYYKGEKSDIAIWKNRPAPEWW